jgi:oligo-1,6-glucosidase
MLFLFDHVNIDQNGSKWNIEPFKPAKLRSVMSGQQAAVRDAGWASLYFNNHDQPRVVSRWGDTSTEELRSRSAKALGLLLHMHRGTPYVYQGEELGMTNAGFTKLSQYRDLESINLYHQLVDDAKVQTAQSMLHAIGVMGRDNARTPMQWDGSKYAGFTAPDANEEPWIPVNPNHVDINAAGEFDDPDSVYAFYKQLIALRHNNPVVSAGRWDAIDTDDESVYAFTRTLEYEEDADEPAGKILVIANLTSHSANMPSQSTAVLNQGSESGTISLSDLDTDDVLISTISAEDTVASLFDGTLSAWEAFAYRIQ